MNTIITLAIIAGLLVLILVIINRIKESIRRSGVGQFIELAKKADIQSQLEPKSVSGGDRIFLPLILKDYPDFDVEKAKATVATTIGDIFEDKDRKNIPSNILSVADNINNHYKGGVTKIKFHTTAISNYVKTSQSATVTFQTAFQFFYKDRTYQERYETEYTLFYNAELSKDKEDNVVTMRCDYCGAPLADAKTEVCEYCGNSVDLMQNKLWVINNLNIK